MNLDAFVRQRTPEWEELGRLVQSARRRPERLGPAGVRRLGSIYRAVAADLALARRRWPGDPVTVRLEDLVGRSRHLGRQATLAGQILTNNIQVSFVAFAGGILAGVGTTLVLLYNGALIGGVAGLTVAAGRPGPFLSLVAPHGVLELSVIAVSGAAGFSVGWSLIDPGRRSRRVALGLGARRGAEIVLG